MTSLRPDEFEALVPHFAEAVAATQAGGERKARLTSLEDELCLS
jgi:hypothetical protein